MAFITVISLRTARVLTVHLGALVLQYDITGVIMLHVPAGGISPGLPQVPEQRFVSRSLYELSDSRLQLQLVLLGTLVFNVVSMDTNGLADLCRRVDVLHAGFDSLKFGELSIWQVGISEQDQLISDTFQGGVCAEIHILEMSTDIRGYFLVELCDSF